MKRGIQFTGIIGLIAVIFGIVIETVLSYDDFYLAPLHFAVGGVLILTFLIFGGTKFIESAAASRAAGRAAGRRAGSARPPRSRVRRKRLPPRKPPRSRSRA